jgi:hypothetical protein
MRPASVASEIRFIPELLLGYEAVESADRRNLAGFLAAIVRRRGFPVHVTSLWNALYFGYDLDEPGYLGRGINLDRIPPRRMGQRDDALPVGGFVRVQTPTEELWAEVVYKEGRHEQVTCDWVPAAISGAPAQSAGHDGRTIAPVREALVLDYSAFGPGWNDIRPAKFARLLRQGRWLDCFGHLVMDALYPPEAAALDDATFYARYLFEQHRDGLGLLASYLGSGATDDDLWTHLLTSIRTVGDIAQGCSELASWRGYFFDRGDFTASVGDESADVRFGADELRHLFKRLSNPPGRERVVYTAIGPQILDVLGRQGLDDAERALVEGPRYVRTVCYANAYVRDRLAEDAPKGILANGCHLRLDDAWQAGGIWRAEAVRDPGASLVRLPPTFALGLGYASTQPVDRCEDEHETPIIPSSQVGWHVALTRSEIDAGVFRLSPSAASALADAECVMVRLRHGSETLDQPTARFDRSARRVLDVEWPWDVYPGIYVFGNIERGGRVVKLRTELLAHPETIDGHELRYRYAEAIYRREREPVSSETLQAATSLDDLIHAVFRGRGRRTATGGRALSMVEVVNAILGPGHTLEASRPIRLALQALDLEYCDGLYVWYPRVTRRTRVLDRTLLAAYGEASHARIRRIVRRHWVPMFLRRLTGGRQPSPEKRADYARALRESGLYGVFRPELPEGYTWVTGHVRGSRHDLDE